MDLRDIVARHLWREYRGLDWQEAQREAERVLRDQGAKSGSRY